MNPTLLRSSLRYLARHRLQSVLLVISIALGVAMVVSIDLANRSASRAFEISTESLTGRATHRIVGGPTGLDDALYRRLRVDLGLRDTAPVVESFVTAVELDQQPMRLLGVDPFAEAPFRSYLGTNGADAPVADLTALLVQPSTVLLSEDLANRYRLKLGGNLTVRWNTHERSLQIAGLLRPSDDVTRRALQGLILADISTAQEIVGQIGRLSYIDLIADDRTPAGQGLLEQVQAILPPDARIERSEARSETVEQMTDAFELNLTALSLLALLVGMFLIYNTVTFSVVQRRQVIGAFRALGVTRSQIFRLILSEAAAVGALGAILGLGLGLILGRGMVQLVTQTINDLYFTVSVREVAVEPGILIKGAVLGLVASLAAATIPALEATSIPPQGTLRRSEVESRARRFLPWITAASVVLVALGVVVLLLPTRRVDVSFAGLFLVLIGIAGLVPTLTVLLMAVARPISTRLFGVLGRMAPRSIVRSLSRTSVAVAALMVSVSVIVGVSIMIGSFRATVEDWLNTTVQADVFIGPPGVAANRASGTLDPALQAEIQSLPEVARVETARTAVVDSPDFGQVNLLAISDDVAHRRRFLWMAESPDRLWQTVRQGAVLVSEPFARRHALPAGPSPDFRLHLQTDRGVVEFPIAGEYYDYASDQGTVLLADEVYRQYWNDTNISSLALFVRPGTNVDALVQQLQARFAGRSELVIRSNQGLRQSALETFDRTFAITAALRLLAIVVSFIGVLSALMSLQLDRTRELGVLRATGMTIRQLWSLTLLETGLMGAVAGLLALPTGLILAIILVYVINLRSFGWTLQMQLRPEYFFQSVLIALAAALLAGIYPALRLGRMVTVEALRTE